MWLKWFIMGAGCVPMLWSCDAAGQAATNHTALVVTNFGPSATTRILRSTNGNLIIISTNALGSVRGRTLQVPQQLNDLKTDLKVPAPGVYKTEPYACIVIVPGEHPDDKCVIHPPEPVPNMPVVKPELRFIPVPPK
jgi:hypothetical protein